MAIANQTSRLYLLCPRYSCNETLHIFIRADCEAPSGGTDTPETLRDLLAHKRQVLRHKLQSQVIIAQCAPPVQYLCVCARMYVCTTQMSFPKVVVHFFERAMIYFLTYSRMTIVGYGHPMEGSSYTRSLLSRYFFTSTKS